MEISQIEIDKISFDTFLINDPSKENKLEEKKKEYRRQKIADYQGELDYELFDFLNNSKVSTHSLNGKRLINEWKQQELENIPLNEEVDRTKMLFLLLTKEQLTYEKAEILLDENPNHFISIMTILASNFNRNIAEVRDKQLMKEGGEYTGARFAFTPNEEVVFLTGRTLLNEYHKIYEDEYVKKLISEIDGIICEYNRGLIMKEGKKYLSFMSVDEIIAEGQSIIFESALRKFDIDMNTKFSTYAYFWIVQRLRRYSREIRNDVYVPHHMIDTTIKVKQEQEKQITIDEAIENVRKREMEINKDRYFPKKNETIRQALRAQKSPLSLDSPYYSKSKSFAEKTDLYNYIPNKNPTPEEELEEKQEKENLLVLLNDASLIDLEKKVILFYTGFNIDSINPNNEQLLLRDIAERLNIKYSQVRTHLANAKTKLKIVAGLIPPKGSDKRKE